MLVRRSAKRWKWYTLLAGGMAVGLAAGIAWSLARMERGGDPAITVPPLSDAGRAGQALFERNCVGCHGPNAAGSERGPALVHRVYHPSHHGDVAFELAVRRGVRAHHWRFSDMPAQASVTVSEVAQITRYVRELQKANGIY